MDSTYRSLIVPAILSALSLAATFYWFGKWEREASLGAPDAKPIAYLKSNTEKIERRSKSRIIWQSIDEGGSLYSGDAVRTPPKAEGNVQLIQGDTVVTLEPDSLIVLEDGKGRLELNLVSGSLLVDSKGGKSAQNGPVIRSGSTKLELGKGGTQLSLSRNKGSEASVAVGKGQVEIASGDKKLVVGEGKVGTVSSSGVASAAGLETLGPKPNEIILLNKLPGRAASFTWKPLSGDGQIHLELGPFRNEVKDTGVAAGIATGRLLYAVPAGPFYWRLVRRDATGKPGTSSMVLRAEGLFLAPPSLYGPAADETFVLKPKMPGISFNWSKPGKSSEVTLEVSGDKSFAAGVSRFKANGDEQEKTVNLAKEGVYYWRVVAKSEASPDPIPSETRRLEIRKMQDLQSPTLTSPSSGVTISEGAMKAQGLVFEWDKVVGANKYRLQIISNGKPIVDETLSSSGYRLKDLDPGSFEWRVMAVASEGASSKWSSSRSLKVNRAAELMWRSTFAGAHEYTTAKPSVPLAWEHGPAEITSWRLRSASNKGALASAPWVTTDKPSLVVNHEHDGSNYYEAQGLAANGAVLAVTSPLRVEVKAKPELDPPILQSSKATLVATADGSLALKWKEVDGATAYGIELTAEGGDKTKEFKSSQTSYVLRDLLPGKYELKLRSQSQAKPGRFGKSRRVIVPNVSDVPPPVLSVIKVH